MEFLYFIVDPGVQTISPFLFHSDNRAAEMLNKVFPGQKTENIILVQTEN